MGEMWTDWGNGYTEHTRGWMNTCLAFEGKEIARTDGDTVIAYDKQHRAMIEEWAEWYGFEIVWQNR